MHNLAPFPPSSDIVVLDTNVIRGIGYGEHPWIETFQEMSKNGYAFTLSDLGLAEFGFQFASGKVTRDEFLKALTLSETFLYAQVPIFPSRSDILGMIGGVGTKRKFDPDEIVDAATRAWKDLKSMADLSDADKAERQTEIAKDIEDERAGWRNFFDREVQKSSASADSLERAFTDFDASTPCNPPPASTRFDFKIRHLYRKCLHFLKGSGPYDPSKEKNKNDGLDVDLLHYLAVPAYVVTYDSGLLAAAKDIKSFQSLWLMKPDDLATAWQTKKVPPLHWPAG